MAGRLDKSMGINIFGRDVSASKALKSVGKASDSLGAKMAKVGKRSAQALAAIGVAAAGLAVKFAKDSVMAAAEFDQKIQTLGVNAGITGGQLKAMADLALQFGADTVFSAGEVANAMLELSKGGLKAAEIQGGALASTLNLAATEGMDLAEAATVVVQAMNTFKISAEGTTKVVDILAAGAVASTAGVTELSAALKFVGTTAASSNVPLEDTITALAALNNVGVDATTAGTSLNQMLLRLSPRTRKAAKAAEAYGLAFYNANGELKPMTEIVKDLVHEFGNLSTESRNRALTDIFGVEGMRAANALIETGIKGYKSLRSEVTKTGVAQEMADARMSGVAGTMEAISGSIETLKIQVGTELAPAFQQMLETVIPAINGIADGFAGDNGSVAVAADVARGHLRDLQRESMDPMAKAGYELGQTFREIATALGLLDSTGKAMQDGPFVQFLRTVNSLLESIMNFTLSNQRNWTVIKQIFTNPTSLFWNGDRAQKFVDEQTNTYVDPVTGMVRPGRNPLRGGRAVGGTVMPGGTYLVGERGPELLRMGSSGGRIIPNHRLGGGMNVQVVVQGSVIAEKDLALSVRNQIAQLMRRQGADPAVLGVGR